MDQDPRPLVWINGDAYDVSNYEQWHPGGSVLEHFIGRDVTTAFYATHPPSAHTWLAMKRVKTDTPAPPECNKKLRDDYLELHRKFTQVGWLTPSARPFLKYIGQSAVFLALALFLPWGSDGKLPSHLLGVLLGLCLHQAAFTVHDTLHGGLFESKSKARWVGIIMGDLLFGVVGDQWDEEHVVHHVMVNCVDHDLQQRNSPLLTVDHKQVTEKRDRIVVPQQVEEWLLRVNHWLWLPAAVLAGRFALQFVTLQWMMQDLKNRAWHMVLFVCHWSWLIALLRWRSSDFPTVGGVNLGPWFAGYTAIAVAGILHCQLLMNHASRPMTNDKDAVRSKATDWVEWQVHGTADVEVPKFMDWFHGGLQFQIAHHLFPRMQSDRYRAATGVIYDFLRRHGQNVHVLKGFTGGIKGVTGQMAGATQEVGYEPWYLWQLGKCSLNLPHFVFVIHHTIGLVFLPMLPINDVLYMKLWSVIYLTQLSLYFFPILGIA